ncbi:Bgt-2363 [Blumeria graminis f. sp. tritici]|uniref:Di-and tri-peptidase n=4 Tax=Blumeria graminis TaxID=34373 RepID=A0A656KR49_BLUGR|nr:di- and tri-peptidase [Blumeria graminis f. sp. tritici 96224]VDB87677.1 Bgt-2363 [Blumeria graminis f. sp. tritici]
MSCDSNSTEPIDERIYETTDSSIDNFSRPSNTTPELAHHLENHCSILALAVGDHHVYAGTQDGEIVVWSLASYEIVKRIKAHTRSVLCLFLSEDGKLLFSSAGDAIVNAWCPTSLKRLHHIYSTYDVGDIFSVSHSAQFEMVYLGSQNTSIQWCSLKDFDSRIPPNPDNHPDRRNHRFFDSVAGGGSSTPRSPSTKCLAENNTLLEINKSHMVQYAHFGYVYCMLMARGVSQLVETNEDILISGGGDGTIKLWQLSHDQDKGIKEIGCLGEDDAESVLSMALNGSFLYSSKLKGIIELWDLDTKQKVRVIKAHGGDITTLQMGWGFLFSAGSNGYARQYTTIQLNQRDESILSPYYQCVSQWQAHNGRIMASAMTIYQGQKIYITGASDNSISFWNISGCDPTEKQLEASTENQLIKSLQEFVSFKTISSRAIHAEDCRRGATFLRKLFEKHGAQTHMLNNQNKWNPLIYAKFKGNPSTSANRKRILFYGHYDVVPADEKHQNWMINPFEMKGINGYLYGRGVSDNKGPIMAAIYGVLDLVQEKKLESDITFLIEGEEESGSRGFEFAVRKNKELIGHIDYVLLANSYWINDEVPCLTYGLRGVIHATITVQSKNPDVHSGVDGSHMLDESLFDLTSILAKLKGPKNRILIPGFYDSILPLTAAEERLYDDITETLVQLNPEIGSRDALKASLMARWREPNLTIHRYYVSGPEGSLISSQANASISLRLVPNQEVEDIIKSLTSFLSDTFAQLHSQNELAVNIDNYADAWLGDPKNTIFQTLESAILDVWSHGEERNGVKIPEPSPGFPMTSGSQEKCSAINLEQVNSQISSSVGPNSEIPTLPEKITLHEPRFKLPNDVEKLNKKCHKLLYIREGGSIPCTRFLEKEFNAPAAHLPCGQASDSAHLNNERLRISNLYKSREIFKRVFWELPRK